jgi:hypothetical protein
LQTRLMEAENLDAPSTRPTSSILELERKVSVGMRNSRQFSIRDDGSLSRERSGNVDVEHDFRGGPRRSSSRLSRESNSS